MNHGQRGFTLSELLLSAAILAFALTGILSLFLSCIFLNDANRNLHIATGHAQFALEETKNSGFANITTTSWSTSTIASKGLITLTSEAVSIAVSGTDPKDVVVTVTWQDRGSRSRTVSLETMFTNI